MNENCTGIAKFYVNNDIFDKTTTSTSTKPTTKQQNKNPFLSRDLNTGPLAPQFGVLLFGHLDN